MLIAGWSSKGGSGTTVVCAALSMLLSSSRSGCTLVDLAGDVPSLLGMGQPTSGAAAGPVTVRPGLDVLAPGCRLLADEEPGVAVDRLVTLAVPRPVVADCGLIGAGSNGLRVEVAAAADISLLVLRPCFLALRRAVDAPIRPSGVVLVNEPGRSLRKADVEDVLGVPVRAQVPWKASVARAVDAGLLARALPIELQRSLRSAA